MTGRAISVLGLLTGIIALSSLECEAFRAPLDAQTQSLTGSVLEGYRNMRDGLFTEFGFVLSGAINWLGNWISLLPPAPWFSFPSFLKDFAVFHTTYVIGVRRSWPMATNSQPPLLFYVLGSFYALRFFLGPANASPDAGAYSRQRRLLIWMLSPYFLGAALFFLLVYIENGIGPQ